MSELLRLYESDELRQDGYPFAWARESMASEQRGLPNDGPILNPPIKDYVRELADHRCVRCAHPYPPWIAKTCPRGEWTPCDEHCHHGGPIETYQDGWWLPQDDPRHIKTMRAQWRILTVHHLDGDKANCRWWNLAALCQRCHLAIQGRVRMERVWPWEHSDWFKPYVAGFYALVYLGEDLDRAETETRLDELLALELVA